MKVLGEKRFAHLVHIVDKSAALPGVNRSLSNRLPSARRTSRGGWLCRGSEQRLITTVSRRGDCVPWSAGPVGTTRLLIMMQAAKRQGLRRRCGRGGGFHGTSDMVGGY